MEFLIEFVLLLLVQYPGAFIRFAIFRKKSFKEYLKDDPYWNAFPVLLIVSGCILLIKYGL